MALVAVVQTLDFFYVSTTMPAPSEKVSAKASLGGCVVFTIEPTDRSSRIKIVTNLSLLKLLEMCDVVCVRNCVREVQMLKNKTFFFGCGHRPLRFLDFAFAGTAGPKKEVILGDSDHVVSLTFLAMSIATTNCLPFR